LIFGTWVKKERYQMEAPMNSKTGKLVETPVFRGRYVRGSFNWADFSEEDRVSFTMAKLMNDLSEADRAKWSMAV
jgi:tRNA(His) guanylyltransferase